MKSLHSQQTYVAMTRVVKPKIMHVVVLLFRRVSAGLRASNTSFTSVNTHTHTHTHTQGKNLVSSGTQIMSKQGEVMIFFSQALAQNPKTTAIFWYSAETTFRLGSLTHFPPFGQASSFATWWRMARSSARDRPLPRSR